MVFIRLTQQPESLPILIRSSRIAAIARTEDGSRVFLGGALSCLVSETEDEVLAALTPDAPDDH